MAVRCGAVDRLPRHSPVAFRLRIGTMPERRTDSRRPMHQRAELAILFADIADSTKLYDALGDERAREIVRRCVAAWSG